MAKKGWSRPPMSRERFRNQFRSLIGNPFNVIVLITLIIPAALIQRTVKKIHDIHNPPYNTLSGTDVELDADYRFSGVELTLPEGFFVVGGEGYNMARNKLSADTLLFFETEAVPREEFGREAIGAQLARAYGEGSKGVTDYRAYEIDGHPAVLYGTVYEDEKQYDVITVCCVLFPERTVQIEFHDFSGRYSDAFARSVDTIRVIDA